MTDFWVSKKQYWCKYCSIFIRDDAPSRTQHETGFRHQGNKERFLRDIYKTGERAVRDKEEERRVMERIDKAANEAHAAANTIAPPSTTSTSFTSSAQPLASSSSSSSRPTGSNPSSASTSTDPYANYSSAASLGYIDAETIAAEKAAALAAEKAKVGDVGGWEVVAVHDKPSGPRFRGAGRNADTVAGDDVDGEGEGEDERYALNGNANGLDLNDPDAIDRFRHRNALNALYGTLGTDDAEEARSHDLTGSGGGAAGKSRGGTHARGGGLGARASGRSHRDEEDDDWDSEAALRNAAARGKIVITEETILQRRQREEAELRVKQEELERRGLDRERIRAWGGVIIGKKRNLGVKAEVKDEDIKPDLATEGSKPVNAEGEVNTGVPTFTAPHPDDIAAHTTTAQDTLPSTSEIEEAKPGAASIEAGASAEAAGVGGSGIFRKRKGAGAGGRSVRQKT